MKKNYKTKKNQIRIIGGRWKNKKISFLIKEDGLRPTIERIRETLFNWLDPYIVNLRCLDCYTGSGALSLEALSRKADCVTLLEINSKIIYNLKKVFLNLGIYNIQLINTNTLFWLMNKGHPYDLVFIDPPFYKGMVEKTIFLLDKYKWLSTKSFIYVEHESKIEYLAVPRKWSIHKEKSTKNIVFRLYLYKN